MAIKAVLGGGFIAHWWLAARGFLADGRHALRFPDGRVWDATNGWRSAP